MIWNVQLVFDCADPDEVMVFWGPTLEYEGDNVWTDKAALREWRMGFPQFDGRGRIDDAAARRTPIYIQKVPERKERPNRLKLEIVVPRGRIGEVTPGVLGRGATRDGGGFRDREGNEFSIVSGDVDDVALRTVMIDALDPDRMLDFWSKVTGYVVSDGRCDPPPARIDAGALVVAGERVDHPSVNWALGINNDPASMPDRAVLDLTPGIAFRKVDERKTIKNRLHLDLRSTDKEAELLRLKELGASVQRMNDEFCVLQDPEGNEFCLS